MFNVVVVVLDNWLIVVLLCWKFMIICMVIFVGKVDMFCVVMLWFLVKIIIWGVLIEGFVFLC